MGHLPHLEAFGDALSPGTGRASMACVAGLASDGELRPQRAEVVAALSLALDLGLGQPMEHMLRSAIIACRLSKVLGFDAQQRGVVYYGDLLSWIGCHADSPEVSVLFDDDIGYRAATYEVDLVGLPLMRLLLDHVAADQPPVRRTVSRAAFMVTAREQMTKVIQSHYVSAGCLADRLHMGPDVRTALGFTFERWDGAGLPTGAAKEDIPIEMRVVHVADVGEVFLREHGLEEAIAMVRKRSGTQFDPAVAEAFVHEAPNLARDLPVGDAWRAALDEAPDRDLTLTSDGLDELLVAIADFVDLQSPYRHGHSRRVADLASSATLAYGLSEAEAQLVRRAGWVHDIGRLGVSSGVWAKAKPLTSAERERVYLYPHLTQRIVSRVPGLKPVADLAGLHRERLDGSGYPKGVDAPSLSVSARILAAADAYQSLTEPRSFREALSESSASRRLHEAVAAGSLDAAAVETTLHAARQEAPSAVTAPGGLTPRELEILRMVALGRANREIADLLVLSEKTVRNHLEHIYTKAGVSNRVSASLFALKHGITRAT
jgi:HD-GYP domain-containing protein (c-di-GMP phosphodiesterase class II)